MSIMELDGFGYKMKEFLGIFMGELLSYRIRIKGKSKDVKTKDPNTGAKIVIGNRIILEKDKMKMICQAFKDKKFLKVIVAPEKPNKYISEEFMDLVNEGLQKARTKLIAKEHKKETDFEAIVLTKLSALAAGGGGGGPIALTCQKCKAPLPPARSGTVVCPYCETTNVI
ncbi:MAG: hypothetical protein ACTSVY_06280 [Candidatus Helarchaeota archaeon]